MLEDLPPGLRVPRAHVDEVTSAHEALAVFALAVRRPWRAETLVVYLDARRRGVGLRAYAPGRDLGLLADRIVGDAVRVSGATACLVCSVRPVRPRTAPEDGARWRTARRIADRAGLAMVAWYLAGPGGVSEVRAA